MKRAFGMAPVLVSRGDRVSIAIQDDPDNRAIASRNHEVEFHWFRPGGVLQERRAKVSLINRTSPDVVFICGLGLRNYLTPALAQHPCVLMDYVELESSLAGSPLHRRLMNVLLENRSSKAFSGHVVASRWLEQWLRKSRQTQQPVFLFPYAAPSGDPPTPQQTERFRLSVGFGKAFVYSGGFYRNYEFWTMLHAIKLLRDHGVKLYLLGRGPEREAGERFVRANGLEANVRFVGYVPDTEYPFWLSAATALLAPLQDTVTDRARCPSKIPLYMTARRPIITCKIGEAYNYLHDQGSYYEPGNAASLASVMLRHWRRPEIAAVDYRIDKVSWERGTLAWRDWLSRHF